MKVYLDNAATTPLDKEVLDAMMPYMTNHFGNPSSTHGFGRKAKTAVETARRNISRKLNVTPGEICFTSGGTEADNLAMRAAVHDLGATRIIISAVEHNAVIRTAEVLEAQGLVKVEFVKLTDKGDIDLGHLEELLNSPEKTLVSLMHGNNEIGNMLPIKEVGEMCRTHNAIFHSDTVQTMGHYHLDLNEIPVDFVTCAGHKFHGPKGIGFLYVNKKLKISALITGGGQERQLRGGTENLYGIVGLSKAFDVAYRDMEEHQKYVSDIKQYMVKQLEEKLPGVKFNGDSKSPDSLYTVLNVTLPKNPNSSMLLFLLDIEGVACSGGSACSSGASKGSHVLTAIDAIEPDCASVRFSFSKYTTREEIDFCVGKLVELCRVEVEAQ